MNKLPYFILGGVALVGSIFLIAIWVVTASHPESLRLQLAREDQIINDLIYYGQLRQAMALAGLLLAALLASAIVVALSRRLLSWGKKGSRTVLLGQPFCQECLMQYERSVDVPMAALPKTVSPPLRERVQSWIIPEEVEVL
jgi:hypothetical protein